MKGSTTYLNWFRRLLVLGAVVAAGAITASAGAVGRPPDVQDAATAAQTTDVGTPPDVADYATALHQTAAGLTADGLRWQGIARTYEQLESVQGYPTALGLKADGLRLQGEAQVYQQLQDGPDVFERYASAHPYGNGLSVSTATIVSRPPDVSDAARSVQAGSFDETFVTRPPDVVDAAVALGNESPSTSDDGFAWSDWGIGIGMGAGFALILGACLIIGRQLKHRGVQPA
jgi:hypothetical protein